MTRIIKTLDEISQDYDALFCDLWGCVHNGIAPFSEAVAALTAFKAQDGIVVLLTNAPRPFPSVEKQLSRMGLPNDCWDTIATSGDSARAAMFRGAVGEKVFFIGEDHDQSFFTPMDIVEDPVDIQQVKLEDAEGIVCCGPFDAHADPSVMRPEFLYAKQKGLKLLCANPDIVVDRGKTREWCAGALAQLYTEMGGESLYFGKPHPPIYDLARRRLINLWHDIPDNRILAIGDGIKTDILGASGEQIDSVFITGGLAAIETKTQDHPDQKALDAFLETEMVTPTFAMGQLR
ncbi:TIGR01459 family HAD-type hydrolase [Parasulfitobacter algicola]|uniref:TIGR01459 family HAD-type hydrolase n=1 Tax=Parasulfitobacter algicola TaxID=2614809 RepID=A0ABX2IZU5_9RHOB|nr:TIGR01459 family HAD-type hydrolase [Sulfitobacter algicola]NSX55928.1 TIGR01459 family HAD-type hydrolase [Sulfitobacter algicola]